MARRTTLRSSKGKKLYAVRNADGSFKDIQTYERAHAADLRRTAKSEKPVRAKAAKKRAAVKKAAAKTAAVRKTAVRKTAKKATKTTAARKKVRRG